MLKQKEFRERATGGLFCENTKYVAATAAVWSLLAKDTM